MLYLEAITKAGEVGSHMNLDFVFQRTRSSQHRECLEIGIENLRLNNMACLVPFKIQSTNNGADNPVGFGKVRPCTASQDGATAMRSRLFKWTT